MTTALTVEQLKAISAIERACSVLSLLGCLFVIVTFCMSSAFHKPINRLVFYASFGNMMTNVGTLMSRSYLGDVLSVGCQFQAFLIQMFMPADAYWTLAMAVNVYLTFYYKFDAVSLRRMEIPYLILCYGVPMIPALTFVFVKDSNGTRVYGNALLWCWISLDWDIWRIASFYGPVWVVIIVTFFIYIRAGRTIYERRKQLQGFQSSDQDPLTFNGDLIFPIKTTEVIVTSEPASSANAAMKFEPLTTISALQPRLSSDNRAYSIHVTSNSATSTHSTDDAGLQIHGPADEAKAVPQPISNFSTGPKQQRVARAAANHTRRRNHELNNAAWSYTKCAILFFTAILITWIPSSANRVFSVIHKGEVSVVLGFMSAFVLPLQGFWNATIYAVTSWSACKNLWHDLRIGRRAPDGTELMGGMPPASSQSRQSQHYSASSVSTEENRKHSHVFQSSSNSKRSKPFDTESAIELSTSRSTSADGRY